MATPALMVPSGSTVKVNVIPLEVSGAALVNACGPRPRAAPLRGTAEVSTKTQLQRLSNIATTSVVLY